MNESTPIVVSVSSSAAIWTSIVALITALITAFIAYLNYRTRSQLLVTKEKHTEQLHFILSEWNKSLGEGCMPNILVRSHTSLWSPLNDRAATNPTLFEDLRGHEPAGFTIFSDWGEFKNIAQQCDGGIDDLFLDISQYVSNLLKNPWFSGVEISYEYTGLIYECTILRAQNSSPSWVGCSPKLYEYGIADTKWFGCEIGRKAIIVKGTKENVERAADLFVQIIESLSNRQSTEYTKFVAKAVNLHEMAVVLEQKRKKLYQDIEEMRAIPILPGDCKHIKRAIDPLFGNFKLKRFR